MYYKVKVWSAEDCTKKESYYIKETLPYVDRNCLEGFFKKVTDYQVSVVALPAHVTKLKKKFKVWDSFELQEHIRNLKFYTTKAHEVDEWSIVATFYKKKPFDIENSFFNGKWYSFCKRVQGYSDLQGYSYSSNAIFSTLKSIKADLPDDSYYNAVVDKSEFTIGTTIYGDPYLIGKYTWCYDGYGHVHLSKLVGTHTEYTKEEIVL